MKATPHFNKIFQERQLHTVLSALLGYVLWLAILVYILAWPVRRVVGFARRGQAS